jgi:hypothetical protein
MEYFIGKQSRNKLATFVRTILMHRIKWYIYKTSRRKSLPTAEGLDWEIEDLGRVLEGTRYRGLLSTVWIT